jgi:hypothetical protein
MTRSMFLAIATLLVPSRARADDNEHRTALPFTRFSIFVGDHELGDLHTDFDGFAVALGLDHRTWSVYGELQLGYQRDKSTLSGLGANGALHARHAIRRETWGGDDVALLSWIDVGAGVQTFYSHNTSMRRPALSLGLGGGGDFEARRSKRIGLELELRITAASSIDWATAEPRCTGGCNSHLDRFDFGTMLLASIPFSL